MSSDPEPREAALLRAERAIVLTRDALVARDLDEAFHQLYEYADPTFTVLDPWGPIERRVGWPACEVEA